MKVKILISDQFHSAISRASSQVVVKSNDLASSPLDCAPKIFSRFQNLSGQRPLLDHVHCLPNLLYFARADNNPVFIPQCGVVCNPADCDLNWRQIV